MFGVTAQIVTARYVAFWCGKATPTLSHSGRDRVVTRTSVYGRDNALVATYSRQVPCRLWTQVTTDKVSPYGGDSPYVAFSDREGLATCSEFSFHCDSIFLAPMKFLSTVLL
ncbi:hypothetical protein Taro_052606 [Colocasia esculenta]|uniref:Uncharacterized protein n=1 Tax=Colocasia esculenta TaxID=4460 RepID=A0A843XIW2_COLES|nr:hypothetical protein [Colocasia esculenta]